MIGSPAPHREELAASCESETSAHEGACTLHALIRHLLTFQVFRVSNPKPSTQQALERDIANFEKDRGGRLRAAQAKVKSAKAAAEAARAALRAADAGLTAAKAEAEAAEAQLGEVGAAIDAAEAALKGGAADRLSRQPQRRVIKRIGHIEIWTLESVWQQRAGLEGSATKAALAGLNNTVVRSVIKL